MRLVLILMVFGIFSCGQKKIAEQEQAVVIEPVKYAVFGDSISDKGTVAAVKFADTFSSDSTNIKLVGTASAVCKKKGCWMNVDLGNEKTMKVTFKDYGFFVPKDIENKKVIFEGIAKKQITAVDVLKHYAEDAGKSQEEIDAITEAKEEIVFVASGVLIESE